MIKQLEALRGKLYAAFNYELHEGRGDMLRLQSLNKAIRDVQTAIDGQDKGAPQEQTTVAAHMMGYAAENLINAIQGIKANE